MDTLNYRMVICMMMFIFFASSISADPDMLQDVCVADLASDVHMNGYACKPNVSAHDFFFGGLAYPRPTDNIYRATVSQASVLNITGLNTQGMSISRIDFAPGGLNPPHLHPRSSEIFFVLEGELYVAFVTTQYKLYSHTIKAGDLFVFPRGLIHFQINYGDVRAVALAVFNSQYPGIQRVANALFASSPIVDDAVLGVTFGIGIDEVKKIRSRLAHKN